MADYRATRPKVERKIAHLMRRRHGGRRARVRGQTKIAADFALLAAAVNLARLSVLGVSQHTRPGMGRDRRMNTTGQARPMGRRSPDRLGWKSALRPAASISELRAVLTRLARSNDGPAHHPTT